MAGETNGTSCLLYRFDGAFDMALVGQMELTSTFNGTPVDISSKSTDDFITLMNADLSTKGRTVTGTLVYSNDAEYKLIKASALAGVISEYMLDYGSELIADQVRFFGIPNAPSDALPMGDKVTTSISILSVGEDI